MTQSRFQSRKLDVYTNQDSHPWSSLLQNLYIFLIISSIKHDQLYLNFVSTCIVRISSYILCLLSSKNINTSQSHQAILVDCHNTVQFLGGEDICYLLLVTSFGGWRLLQALKHRQTSDQNAVSVQKKIGNTIALSYNNIRLCNMLFTNTNWGYYNWEQLYFQLFFALTLHSGH